MYYLTKAYKNPSGLSKANVEVKNNSPDRFSKEQLKVVMSDIGCSPDVLRICEPTLSSINPKTIYSVLQSNMHSPAATPELILS